MTTTAMTMAEALAELGVGPETLTDDQRKQLDEDGYAIFPSLLDADTVRDVRARIVEIEEEEDAWGTATRAVEAGGVRIDDVNHKGAVFDQLWLHPTLLASMHHYLGDFRLSSMTARAARPGMGHQGLHTDWWRPFEDRWTASNSAWLLDDFSEETGSTRLVPGSHKWRQLPHEVLEDPTAPHPHQVQIEAPAGSLVVFNGYLWHSGTKNTGSIARHGLFTVYTCRDCQPQNQQLSLLTRPMADRLSAAGLYILGHPAPHLLAK